MAANSADIFSVFDQLPRLHHTGSATPGTDVHIMGIKSCIHECYNAGASDICNILLGNILKSPFSNSIRFIYWNGVGQLVVKPWSTDSINGLAAGTAKTYDGATDVGGGHRHYLLILYMAYNEQLARGETRIAIMHEGGLADVTGEAPNVQVTADGTVDAGHSTDGSIYFASNAGDAAPTLGGGAIALGTVTGTLAAGEIVIGEGAAANSAGRLTIHGEGM